MTTYPLSAPPKTPGIYCLKNTATGQVYIGQAVNLQRRLYEWRAIMGSKIGKTSQDMMAAANASTLEDWQFMVLAEAPIEKLNDLEKRAIERVRGAQPALCLNREIAKKAASVSSADGKTLITVIGPDGPMSRRQVADYLGISIGAAKDRIKCRRRPGITEIHLKNLGVPRNNL